MKALHLSPGERLIMYRRRLGLQQQALADKMEVDVRTLRKWEKDLELPPKPWPIVVNMTDFEKCYILRLRSGVPRHDMAQEVGVSSQWLTLMEHGEVPWDKLATFWAGRV